MTKLANFEIKVRWQPKQALAWRAIKSALWSCIGYGGARGGGKSYLLRNGLLLRRIEFPGTNGYLFRKTYAELEANHIVPLFKEHPQLIPFYNASKHVLTLPFGQGVDSHLYFRYLQRPQDVYTYQGIEIEDGGLDEATQHSESVFDNLRASNRTSQTIYNANGKKFKPFMGLTFNPGGVGHGWIKRKFVKKQFQPWEDPKDYAFIKALVYDNRKLIEADPAYLKRLESLPPALRKAFLLGSFDVFEGQFFQEWMEMQANGEPYHVVPVFDPPENWKRFIGLDWGYFPDYFVAHWFCVAPNRRLYIYKELTLQQTTATDVAKAMIETSGDDKIAYIMADPSIWNKGRGEEYPSIQEELIEGGIPSMLLRKANNDRKNGWINFRRYLSPAPDGMPWLQVMSNCHDLIRTIPDQVYNQIGDVSDLDTDGDDHWVDAARYGLMSRPFRLKGQVLTQNQGALLEKLSRKAYVVDEQGNTENIHAQLIKNDLRKQERHRDNDDDLIP